MPLTELDESPLFLRAKLMDKSRWLGNGARLAMIARHSADSGPGRGDVTYKALYLCPVKLVIKGAEFARISLRDETPGDTRCFPINMPGRQPREMPLPRAA